VLRVSKKSLWIFRKYGAGDGNRTHVRSLGSFYTAIVRRPLRTKSKRRIPPELRDAQESETLGDARGLLNFGIVEVVAMKIRDRHLAFADAHGGGVVGVAG
jgi:hypothetical protein